MGNVAQRQVQESIHLTHSKQLCGCCCDYAKLSDSWCAAAQIESITARRLLQPSLSQNLSMPWHVDHPTRAGLEHVACFEVFPVRVQVTCQRCTVIRQVTDGASLRMRNPQTDHSDTLRMCPNPGASKQHHQVQAMLDSMKHFNEFCATSCGPANKRALVLPFSSCWSASALQLRTLHNMLSAGKPD